MISLVTLEDCKAALNIDHNDDDNAKLPLLIGAASQAVVRYLKDQAAEIMDLDAIQESPPDLDSVPEDVAVATIMLVGHFYKEPDGDAEKAFERGYLPMPVTALLYPLRDPALA
ncbi:hypothetical protein ABIA24_001794 [Sinorhizobium fredii]|uniref:head-tail connector protein n=1 Tax=Rhizobium fredii TaxID=380 RepID=UPI0035178891